MSHEHLRASAAEIFAEMPLKCPAEIPPKIPGFRFNPEAAEFHCGSDVDQTFGISYNNNNGIASSAAPDIVTVGYPTQMEESGKHYNQGLPQIYTEPVVMYPASVTSSYTGPRTQGYYGSYLTVPASYSRSYGSPTTGFGYQQGLGPFSRSFSEGGYPHSSAYSSYYGSQVGSISESFDIPSGYLTPHNEHLPSRCPSPEVPLIPETIAGHTYDIPAELKALHCFKSILNDLCVTCPINLQQYDRESILRRAMDRLTVAHEPIHFPQSGLLTTKQGENQASRLGRQDAAKNRMKGESKKQVIDRMWRKERGRRGNRRGRSQHRGFGHSYGVLPHLACGQSAGGYVDNGFPGTDFYDDGEQYNGPTEYVEDYDDGEQYHGPTEYVEDDDAENWDAVRQEQ
ncbi:hypothetical protein K440DRAFT_659225 [Wilcoxina mikolae CBS 423.85]|nr:hypothetical protein K440DRAFT_659225 [Wilcoxina mikolae CBS 423.85]